MGILIVKIVEDARLAEGFKTTSFPQWREVKPCEGKECGGHRRMVKVGARKVPNKEYNGSDAWDKAVEAELHWEPFCSAWQALQRASHYAQESRRWMIRFQERLAKQKKSD